MRLKIFFIAAAVAILVSGCGGGGGSTSGEPGANGGSNPAVGQSDSKANSKPMTKEAFVTRINEICIEVPPGYKAKLKELKKAGKKPSKTEINLKAALPPLRSAIEEMEAVVPPPNEAENLSKVIAALESAANGLEAAPTSELSGPGSPFAEFQTVTKRYGFETCSGL